MADSPGVDDDLVREVTETLASPGGGAARNRARLTAVGDPASDRVLFSRDGGSPATPASTAKLATAVAALDVLGPGARFSTRVVEDATAGQATARGAARIILVGGGDPTLAADRAAA